jgi:hypothetical protein
LSSSGAELETELPLEIFAALQIEIPGVAGPGHLMDVKVVGMGEPGVSYIIKFTGLSEAAAAAVNLWLEDKS